MLVREAAFETIYNLVGQEHWRKFGFHPEGSLELLDGLTKECKHGRIHIYFEPEHAIFRYVQRYKDAGDKISGYIEVEYANPRFTAIILAEIGKIFQTR